jgi:hypothetical protein
LEEKVRGKGREEKKERDMVVHACNPNTWEAEVGGSQIQV